MTAGLYSNRALAITFCGATITGGVNPITGTTGPVLIGGTNCAGNTISGRVEIYSNTGGVSYSGNTVTGSVLITGNSGGFQYSGNTATGGATVSGNT